MSENEFLSLNRWVDLQISASSKRSNILSWVLGTSSSILGGSIPILLIFFHLHPLYSIVAPLLILSIIAAITLLWFYFIRSPEEVEMEASQAEARKVWWRLLASRIGGGVTNVIGVDGATKLNSGAEEYLRCRAAFDQPSWKSLPKDSPYLRTKQSVERSMEFAMSQLVILVGRGTPSENHRAEDLITHMRFTAEQVTDLSERISDQRGLTSGAEHDLRASLSHLRALKEAEDEIDRMREPN